MAGLGSVLLQRHCKSRAVAVVPNFTRYRDDARKRAKSAMETGRQLLEARARIKDLETEVAYYKDLAEYRQACLNDVQTTLVSLIEQLIARREVK